MDSHRDRHHFEKVILEFSDFLGFRNAKISSLKFWPHYYAKRILLTKEINTKLFTSFLRNIWKFYFFPSDETEVSLRSISRRWYTRRLYNLLTQLYQQVDLSSEMEVVVQKETHLWDLMEWSKILLVQRNIRQDQDSIPRNQKNKFNFLL